MSAFSYVLVIYCQSKITTFSDFTIDLLHFAKRKGGVGGWVGLGGREETSDAMLNEL